MNEPAEIVRKLRVIEGFRPADALEIINAAADLIEEFTDEKDRLVEHADEFMTQYFPGWYCSSYRCEHYRLAEENSGAWCWLRHGIGAEAMQPECPAYKRAIRLKLIEV